jgi:hypothetical protein
MAKSPKASALVDTRVIYCGDNLDQLRKLPEACVSPGTKLTKAVEARSSL